MRQMKDPIEYVDADGRRIIVTEANLEKGLSRRDYFAGMAMQGVMMGGQMQNTPETIILNAVFFADALIAELDKK